MLCDLVYRVFVDDNRVSRNYLCYWFLCRAGRYQITRDAHGSSLSMVKVSQNSIRSWLVALPPFLEQQAIAFYIDRETAKIDALIAKIRQGIEKLKEYRTALISAAVEHAKKQYCTTRNPNDQRVFNSIIVISDRNIVNQQLQDNIQQFEQVLGTVATPKTGAELKKALHDGKQVIVCSLFLFPQVLRVTSQMLNQRFAVVIDGAHSSQGGKTTRSMNAVLADVPPQPPLVRGEQVSSDHSPLIRGEQVSSDLPPLTRGDRGGSTRGEQKEKVEIIVEHFCDRVQQRINHKAKAMIVTRSRAQAVRYKQAVEAYIQEKGYSFKTLVAFSQTVTLNKVNYTEYNMNSAAAGEPIHNTAEALKKDEYRILIVADKFQTGFDQPLLHTLYVDKPLRDIKAVQTLSRLNRCHPNKNETMVLDFVNDWQTIKNAFQDYYTATTLSQGTQPNRLYTLQRQLQQFGFYNASELDNVTNIYYKNLLKPRKTKTLKPLL